MLDADCFKIEIVKVAELWSSNAANRCSPFSEPYDIVLGMVKRALGKYLSTLLDKSKLIGPLNYLYHQILYLGHRNQKNNKSWSPIFIVGSAHSGTSLMLRLMDNHPDIWSVKDESSLFLQQATVPRKLALFKKWYEVASKDGASRWAEKTPGHVFQIEQFLKYFPKCKIIFMLRDGRDVFCSLSARGLSPAEAIKDWSSSYRAFEPYLNDPRVMLVRYEDVVLNFTQTMKTVFEFLDEKWCDDLLSRDRERLWFSADKLGKPESVVGSRATANYRNWQMNQPIFDGTGRWKSDLDESDKRFFKESAGELLVSLGYAADNDW